MLVPLVLPNKNLGAIQLLGVNTVTTIPFLEQQKEKLKTLSSSRNLAALTKLSVSFYTKGLLSQLGPMIQIETGQQGVEMFGIENLEQILKPSSKTPKEAMVVIKKLLEDLQESVIDLQSEATKILKPQGIQVAKLMLRNEIDKGTPREISLTISKNVETKYNILIEAIEKNKQLPETISWPIALVPRSQNRLSAISTAFYTPPALFKIDIWGKSSPKFLRLFTLISSPKPVLEKDKNQFGRTIELRRATLIKVFNKPAVEILRNSKYWNRPSVVVNLTKRSIDLSVPSAYLSREGVNLYGKYLRHSSYMVAFYAYIQVTLVDKSEKYFSLSFDVGIKMSKLNPRFSPTAPVLLSLSKIEAEHDRGGWNTFSGDTGDDDDDDTKSDLKKWVMTEDETQHLFGLGVKSQITKNWKKVAVHVTRIYIGSATGGSTGRIVDRIAAKEYARFYNDTFKKTPEAHQTVGWASLQKARKLTKLAFPPSEKLSYDPSAKVSTRVDWVRDLNVKVITHKV